MYIMGQQMVLDIREFGYLMVGSRDPGPWVVAQNLAGGLDVGMVPEMLSPCSDPKKLRPFKAGHVAVERVISARFDDVSVGVLD